MSSAICFNLDQSKILSSGNVSRKSANFSAYNVGMPPTKSADGIVIDILVSPLLHL